MVESNKNVKQADSEIVDEELQAAIEEIKADRKWRTEFSKWLSYLLRHGAVKTKGITLRSDGYVPISQILEQPKAKKLQLNELYVRAETQINEKQRYQIESIDGVLMIRAAQGHSMTQIQTEELLEKISDPFLFREVVHGTYYEPMKFIMEGGLNKMGRNHIHFAIGLPDNSGVISGMRKSCEIVIEINMAKAMYGEHKIPFYTSNNNVILSEGLEDGSLPTQYFRSVLDFKAKRFIHEAPIEYICVYDFECTCAKEENVLKSKEIIEFPIVIVDVKNKCIKSTFQVYVKPTIDPQLTDFCTELTGITQQQVDDGVEIQAAMAQVHEFLEKEGILATEFVFLSCGDFDGRHIKRESKLKNFDVPSYLKRWINFKKIFPADFDLRQTNQTNNQEEQKEQIENPEESKEQNETNKGDDEETKEKLEVKQISKKEQSAQEKSKQPFTQLDWANPKTIVKAKDTINDMDLLMKRCGLKLEGRLHSGIDDSKNTAACVIRLLEQGFIFSQGMVNNKEKY